MDSSAQPVGCEEVVTFLSSVRSRVRAEIETPGVLRAAARRHYVKAVLIGGWFVVSFVAVLALDGVATVLLAAVSVGISLAGLAFNVQHDGGHGAFSENRSVNRFAAGVLEFLGASSYLWRWKHNVLHHGYPNVDGEDDDIRGEPVLRLHPDQPWRPWQKYQHIYCWLVYPLLMFKWIFLSDIAEVFRGRVGDYRFPEMSRGQVCLFWLSKVQFCTWALFIPVLVHGWLGVAFFLVFELTGSFTAAMVFQLAQAVEEADHFYRRGAVESSWEQVQLASTVDFRVPRSVEWFLGGLNYQSIHHLFPGIRHTLYPQLAAVVESEAKRFSLPYTRNPSLTYQIGSHYRLLRSLGTKP